MIDESAFAAALDADPDNFDCRLVFADWLEDQGDARAAGVRWLGENRKRPKPWTTKFQWYDDNYSDGSTDIASDIPSKYYSAMDVEEDFHSFPARRAAEDAFCLAFATVAAAEDELRRVREEMSGLECHAFMFSCYENGDRCLCDRAMNAREAALLAVCGEPA